MGLQEKRAIAALEKDLLPQFGKQIEAITGFPVALEIKWDQLAVEGYSDSYAYGFENVFMKPTIQALKAICADDLGKKALQAKLKKVAIQNNDSKIHFGAATLENGTLTLDHCPITNMDNVDSHASEIQSMLESAL